MTHFLIITRLINRNTSKNTDYHKHRTDQHNIV